MKFLTVGIHLTLNAYILNSLWYYNIIRKLESKQKKLESKRKFAVSLCINFVKTYMYVYGKIFKIF